MSDRQHRNFEEQGYLFAVTTEPTELGFRASFVTISQGEQILDQFEPRGATFTSRSAAEHSGRISGLVRLGLPYA